MREIGVTGIGVICAGGSTREQFWTNLCRGQSAIGEMSVVDKRWLGTIVGGEVSDLQDKVQSLPFDAQTYDRTSQLALVAASEAIAHSALDLSRHDRSRIGVIVGTCQGSVPDILGDDRAMSQATIHAPADALAIEFGLAGIRGVVSTSCTAGASAIAMARHILLREEADIVVVGGVDSLSFLILSGFTSVHSLDPRPCAPYSRSGGVNVGEGAGILVLESVAHAANRGVDPLATIMGVGQSSDAYHFVSPDPAGRGAVLAMRRALEQAGMDADQVDYVNGHGNATRSSDRMEVSAMRAMFDGDPPIPPMSTVKGMIGHTLGAAGAIEAAVCVLAIRDGVMPPTVNVEQTQLENDLDIICDTSRKASIDVALSNNFAFGGNNTSVVIAKSPQHTKPQRSAVDEVVVTGIGVVGCLGLGIGDWERGTLRGLDGLGEFQGFDTRALECTLGGEVPYLDDLQIAPPNVWRRMDPLSRQCLASSDLALRDAGYANLNSGDEKCGVITATSGGSIEAIEQFWESALRGPGLVNPLLFPKTAMNSAAGYVSIGRGLKGPSSTITNGNLSGALALMEAVRLIELGECEKVIVVGGDAINRTAVVAAEKFPGMLTRSGQVRPFDKSADGSALSASSVAMVLESATLARRRHRTPYCRLAGHSTANVIDRSRLLTDQPWTDSIEEALDRSRTKTKEVEFCVADAPGVTYIDIQEAEVLAKVFGSQLPVGAPKSFVGHTLACNALVGVLFAALSIQKGVLAPTLHLEDPVGPAVNHLHTPVVGHRVNSVLVNCGFIGGNVASFIVKETQW